MTKKLIWRLSKLPTPDEVIALINAKLITQEEAREVLFKSEESSERDAESYKEEIKFLRGLVEKIGNKTTTIEYIYQYPPNGKGDPWYNPYVTWCYANDTLYASATNGMQVSTTGGTNANLSAISTVGYTDSNMNSALASLQSSTQVPFTEIATF